MSSTRGYENNGEKDAPRLTPLPPLPPVSKVDRSNILDEVVHRGLGARPRRVGRHPEGEVVPGLEREEENDADGDDEHREGEEEEVAVGVEDGEYERKSRGRRKGTD